MEIDRSIKDPFLDNLQRLKTSTENGHLSKGVREIQDKFWNDLLEMGFPTRKTEDWKYTDLRPITSSEYRWANSTEFMHEDDLKSFCDGSDGVSVVFINGLLSEKYSHLDQLPEGITIRFLDDILTSTDDATSRLRDVIYKNNFDEAKKIKLEDPFYLLNQSVSKNGCVIEVKKNAVIQEMIHLVYVTDENANGCMMNPTNVILAGASCEASVLESYVSFDQSKFFMNPISKVYLEENAKLEYVILQAESYESFHVKNTQIVQKKDSQLMNYTISIGSALLRNSLWIKLDDEGCYSSLDGLYMPTGKQHMDNHTFVEHAKPNCSSNQLYKGILTDAARAVFNGKILVRPGAQKTNAYQLNKNILLSRQSHVDTKPELEIYADDVRCTHGATIGQLNEDEIFYFESRGVSRENAVQMLCHAFANNVLERITHKTIAGIVIHLLEKKFSWMSK